MQGAPQKSRWTFLCKLQDGRLDFDLRGRGLSLSWLVVPLGFAGALYGVLALLERGAG